MSNQRSKYKMDNEMEGARCVLTRYLLIYIIYFIWVLLYRNSTCN